MSRQASSPTPGIAPAMREALVFFVKLTHPSGRFALRLKVPFGPNDDKLVLSIEYIPNVLERLVPFHIYGTQVTHIGGSVPNFPLKKADKTPDELVGRREFSRPRAEVGSAAGFNAGFLQGLSTGVERLDEFLEKGTQTHGIDLNAYLFRQPSPIFVVQIHGSGKARRGPNIAPFSERRAGPETTHGA